MSKENDLYPDNLLLALIQIRDLLVLQLITSGVSIEAVARTLKVSAYSLDKYTKGKK